MKAHRSSRISMSEFDWTQMVLFMMFQSMRSRRCSETQDHVFIWSRDWLCVSGVDMCVQINPADLDLCEDLSDLVSVNESSVLHVLTNRAKACHPLTHAGPNVLALWPPQSPAGKV